MLLVQDFFTFFTGIYCDYDGAYGDQCFDLANAYSRWIGGPRFTGATADLIYNQPGDFYIQIPNTPDGVPQRGDIVLWNWPHVGIATGENSSTNQFEVLEQNDPEDSNCHIKQYLNYNGVIGWLRPKQLPQSTQSIEDQLRAERDNNWNLYKGELGKNITLQQQLTDCQNKPVQLTPVVEVSSTTSTETPIEPATNPVVSVAVTTPQSPEITASLQKALDQAKPTWKTYVLDWISKKLSYIKWW